MVTSTYHNDTVDDMDTGDGDGDGPPVRTTNPSSSSFANASKQSEIRTFSYYAVVDLGKFAQGIGEGVGTKDTEVEGRVRLLCMHGEFGFRGYATAVIVRSGSRSHHSMASRLRLMKTFGGKLFGS